jgi:hypothetical protein
MPTNQSTMPRIDKTPVLKLNQERNSGSFVPAGL